MVTAVQQHRFISIAILALLLLTPFTAAAGLSQSHSPPRAHPWLIELASSQPEQRVDVIVRKQNPQAPVDALIAHLGGRVIDDLSIINAVVAVLPARVVPLLAQQPAVQWVSPNGPMESSNTTGGSSTTVNTFLDTLGVRSVWSMGYRGQNIGVALIDSGLNPRSDFKTTDEYSPSRIKSNIIITDGITSTNTSDNYGHGTHVGGIIGGNGYRSNGAYSGIAPRVNLVSVDVTPRNSGAAKESDTVKALQWVYNNRLAHNIKVVNLSMNSTVSQSYHLSPLNAAAEILWFSGVVVIASAGNASSGSGTTINAAPANDPFIITVGASDERGTTSRTDDVVASYSAYGVTSDGHVKPDIIAPGSHIISLVSWSSSWPDLYPSRLRGEGNYLRLSGTSMAAPMVTGAVALLLQKEPNLTPDQVKYRLRNTGSTIAGRTGDTRTYPYLNVYKALTTSTSASANTGIRASQLLWTGSTPVTWSSVNWNSVNWNSVNWNSVNWNSVNWNSVNWNSVNWSD